MATKTKPSAKQPVLGRTMLESHALLQVPERELALWRCIDRAGRGSGTITVADTTLTWSELQIRSHRLACGLRSLGVGHGDRIGSITTDRIECLELAFAAAALAAIWVPIAPFLKGTFLRHQIQSADLDLFFAEAEGLCAR